ncbi:hypothetical protein IAR55_005300 [Kwoniella newhampshirensis]|uniref:Transcriptional adapter 3 n=1 Tax=Kwoniella newhampshirensis TaxID=1651941 RepID=A0AAW0YH31_9TREE
MAPRTSYTPDLRALIESTVYPSLPALNQLESLRHTLIEQSHALSSRLNEGSSGSSSKKKRKEREEEEKERLALEANERAGMRLELLERNRMAQQQKDLGGGKAGKGRAGTGSPSGVRVKRERTSLSPAPSNGSSASFRLNHLHAAPTTYGGQVKKKKKRVMDSDDEALSQTRDRSTTVASPPPHLSHSNHYPHQSSTSGLKLKLSHAHPSQSQIKHARPPTDPSPTPSASAASNNIDFSLPPNPMRPLVPPRPGVQKPMKPGPKKQSEVDEDYSNTKAPSQVAFPTFWSGVEPYLRDVREDDLAMLGFKADAPESYEIPPRGRHYTDVWDEEDGNAPGTTPRFPVPNLRQQQQSQHGQVNGPLAIPHFVPAVELRDENLVDEHRGLGSLTERVVAAVVGKFGFGEKKDESEKRPEAPDDSNREPARVDVVDLEERMHKELRAVMLLGEHDEFDPFNKEDDEVTSALRQCQRLLSQQTALNDARKARLADIAKQRLAYTEYQSALEGVEKAIEASWAKRVKKFGTTPKKSSSSSATPAGRPPIPEHVKKLVGTRQHWIETVGQCMKERPRGEVVGLPGRSVFEGIGEDEEKDEKSVEEGLAIDDMEVDEGSVVG